MANNIKGITIEIDAKPTGLEQALRDINKESQELSSELRQINTQLKFDGSNTTLLKQKFDVLGEQIQKAREKLQTLEDAQEQVEEQFQNGEIDDGQYRAFQRELEKTKNHLEYLEDAQEQVGVALHEDLSSEYENLQTQISETQAHLEDLQNQQDQFKDADINTDAYEALAEEIATTTEELSGLQEQAASVENELNNLEAAADIDFSNISSGAEALKDTGEQSAKASDTISGLSGAFGMAGGAGSLLNGVLGGLSAGGMMGLMNVATQVAEEVIKMAMSFDEANSIIVEKTGESGDALFELNQIAVEVSKTVDNTDLEGVASTVGELATRLDITGEALEEATYLMQQFADATGTDANRAVVDVTKVMKNWGVEVEDMETLLDKLTLAGQKTGISVDDLASSLVTHKAQLKEMGFSLDESIALLANFEKEGVNTSKVLMGMNTAVAKWAAEGVSAKDGFNELANSIKSATSETEAIAAASEYFGRRGAQEIVYAMRSGRFETDELVDALQQSQGVMLKTESNADTMAERIETAFRSMTTESLNSVNVMSRYIGEAFNVSEDLSRSTNAINAFIEALSKGLEPEEAYLASTQGLAEAQATLLEHQNALTEAATLSNEIDAQKSALYDEIAGKTEKRLEDIENMSLMEAMALSQSADAVDQQIAQIYSLSMQQDGLNQLMTQYGEAIVTDKMAVEQFGSAVQANVDAYPEIQAKYLDEQEQLKKQAELESLAAREYESMGKSMDNLGGNLEELQRDYQRTYESARSTIEKQIGLFEKMEADTSLSIDDMISSLDSQISYMDKYSDNMRKAVALGIDDGLLAKLSDGSEKSAGILQAIVDDAGEHMDEINEKFNKVDLGKDSWSRNAADIATDFSNKMSEIEARMSLAVDRMDQYGEAYANGSDTVKGFIAGSKSHYTEIYNAYTKVAQTANRAVKKNLRISSPSKVMMEFGEFTAEGFAIGALKELDTVENAFEKIVKASTLPFDSLDRMSGLAVTRTSRSVVVNAPVQVVKELNDSELNRVGGKITDIVGREFARRTGGAL